MAPELRALLLEMEDERCRCIVEQRYERLRELLSERLVHSHASGRVDDRESYLAYIGGVIESLQLQRDGLRVLPVTDTVALIHGRQVNHARRRGHDERVRVESVVTQVLAREADGVWRFLAFHASPVASAPGAAPADR